MTEETAKALAEAMNRLAAAIEAVPKSPFGGIMVQHNGMNSSSQYPQRQYGPGGNWTNYPTGQ